jgi:hypothetical protein
MATLKAPFALDRSLNTTEENSRNIADVLAEGLSHITGRTASEVEYDNTDSGLTSDDVQGAIDELSERPTLPSVDIQTAVDEFETYNGGLLSSLKVALEPIQDLHGYDHPWVGGAGKNKADINDLSLVQNDSGNKLLISNLALTAGTYTMSFDVSQTITSTRNRPLYVISGANTYAPTDYNTQGRGSWTFTLSADATVTFYWWVADNSLAVDITNFMIESGSTATAYEPYENICPISGHTQVDVDNHQKNLFNPSNIINGYIGQSDGGYKVISLANTRVIYAPCEPNTAYTISKTIGARFNVGWTDTLPDINVTVYGTISNNTASEITLTAGATAKYIVAFVWFGTYDTIIADEMLASCQIELGSTATAYVPYNGYQVTVNLGGTYYSGILDAVTGVFTPDMAFDTLSADNFNGETGTSGGGLHYYDWNNGLSKKSGICLCSMMPQNNTLAWQSTTPCIQMSSGGGVIRCYVEEATKEAFKTAYSGMQICYELANPTPIQLSPTTVKALVGENHLSAPLEGQEITESKYRQLFTWDEVEAYVNAHSGGGSGMNYSTEEQVVGTWFGKTLYQKTVDQTIGSDADYTVFANGIDHAHLVNSIFEYSSGRWFSSGYTSIGVTSNSRTCYVEVQNGALNLHNQSNSSIHWIATIQYTKTTD